MFYYSCIHECVLNACEYVDACACAHTCGCQSNIPGVLCCFLPYTLRQILLVNKPISSLLGLTVWPVISQGPLPLPSSWGYRSSQPRPVFWLLLLFSLNRGAVMIHTRVLRLAEFVTGSSPDPTPPYTHFVLFTRLVDGHLD